MRVAPAELVVAADRNVRIGAAEEALQARLSGVAEMTESEDVFNRLEHRIMVEGDVGHGAGLEERREQDCAGALVQIAEFPSGTVLFWGAGDVDE